MMRRLLLGLGLVGASACLVEETGYNDPTDTNLPGQEADPTADAVDETDDRDADAAEGMSGFLYTSTVPLSSVPELVTVVGLPGSVPVVTSITASVAPDGPEVDASVAGSGFVVSLFAALGDTVVLRSGAGSVIGSVHLGDDLSATASGGVDLPPSGDLGAVLHTDEGLDDPIHEGNGMLEVGDGAISWLAPPYLAYVSSGAAALVNVGDMNVLLPAKVGDTFCVAPVDDSGLPGLASCTVLE